VCVCVCIYIYIYIYIYIERERERERELKIRVSTSRLSQNSSCAGPSEMEPLGKSGSGCSVDVIANQNEPKI
jgi:hypothetical protein